MPEPFEVHERPPARWRLELPPDASMEDVITLINNLKVTFITEDGEAGLFRQMGPSAVWFRRLKAEET